MSAGELSFAALLLRALRARPGDLSEEELRDGLWIALQMDGIEAVAREPPSEPRTERTAEPRLPEARRETRAEEGRELRSPPPAHENPGRSLADATLEAPSRGNEGGGLLFRTPGASALPGALALARALRPLRRRVASQRRFEVDEEATARWISEARAWGAEQSSIRGQVVLRPAKERWFELAVVVDGAASMAIWERTMRELVRLLAYLGAFRDVRVWTLDSEGPRLQLHVGITRLRDRPRSIREVGDPTGRRVIVVLTDGVAEAWRDGRVLVALQEWSAQTPVGLVSVLPEDLWHGTAMRALPGLTVRALRSGETRVRLEKLAGRRMRSGDSERFAELRPIPVASLEPASIARLAGMLTGTGSGSAVLPRLAEEVRAGGGAGPELPGEERVRRFDRLVSPEARRLARLFAVTPLFLPVMRLVQHTMLPGSNQGHLAEVFLGGLLEEVGGTSTEVDAIEYAFRPGVAEVLRQTIEDLADTMAVLRTVSRFVAERIGQPLDFGAALVDPTAKFPAKLAKDRVGRVFARVSAEVLRPLGGEYAVLAEQLGSVGGPEVTSLAPVPVMNENAPFRGQVVLVAGSSRRLTDAERWAAVVVGRGLAQHGFGVASSYFEGVDRTIVEALVTTAGKTPAEKARVRRERVRDFVPVEVCAAIIVGGAEGTWSRVELARYLGIPVLGFAGTGGAAARITREIDLDVQEASIGSEAQAEAVAERLFAELALRVADSGSMPPWVGGEHMPALRTYAVSSSPDPRVLEAMEDAIEAGTIRPSLEELRAGLQDVRPEVRAVVYLCEARVPHVEVIEALANAVVGEVPAGVVVMCSGVFRLGLAALDVHCEQVTTLAEIDVLTAASRSILRMIGNDEHKGWVDGNVHVRATRLERRARASPKLWVTIQSQTYERIRLEAASDERTQQLDAWAEQVQTLAREDRGLRTKTLERQFQTGQDGRRALALACATGGTRTASVGMLYDGIKSSRSGFEQWLALNAALHWLQSAADVDGVVGAILEQVLDDGSKLNPRSKSDRAGIATALLGMYGVRRGHGPGAQSASLRHRWLGEIRDKIGDDTGARASFEVAIRMAAELAEEVHARVGLGLLEARSGDSERAVAELLFVLERTEQIRDAEIGGARLKALVGYSSLCDAPDFRRWIAAAARWELPDVMPENLGTLHEWGEHLLLLAEELPADRAAQRSCYEQALALAEFLIRSPDYEHGERERELAVKARQSLAGLGDRQAELAQAQAQAQAEHDAEHDADRQAKLAQAQADQDAGQDGDRKTERTAHPAPLLQHLLLSLFGSADEFRRWVYLGPDGHELVAEFPSGSAGPSAVISGGLDVLRRHGFLDADFFARLAADFPHHRDAITQAAATSLARDALTFLQRRFPTATIFQKEYPLLSERNGPAIKTMTGFVASFFAAGTKQLLLAVSRLGSMGEVRSLANQLELVKSDLDGSIAITYDNVDDPYGNKISSDTLTWSGVVVLFTDALAVPAMDIRSAFGKTTIEIVDTSTRALGLPSPEPDKRDRSSFDILAMEGRDDPGVLSAIERGWRLLAQPDADGARTIFAEILLRTGLQRPVAATLGMAVFHGLNTQSFSATRWNSYMKTARSEALRQHASIELRRAIALWYGLFSQFDGKPDGCASALAFLRLHPGPASPYTLPIPHVIANLANVTRVRGPGTSRGLRPIEGRNINGDERSRVSGLWAYFRLAAAMNAGSVLPDSDPLWIGLKNNDGSAFWLTDEHKEIEAIRPPESPPSPAAERQAELDAQAQAEHQAELDARDQAAHQAELDARDHAEHQAELDAQDHAEHQAELDVQAQAEHKAELDAQDQAEHQAELDARNQAEHQAELDAQDQAEHQAELDAQDQAEHQAELDAQAQAEHQVGLDAQVQAEHQAELDAQDQAEHQAELDAQDHAEHQAELGAEAHTDISAEDRPTHSGNIVRTPVPRIRLPRSRVLHLSDLHFGTQAQALLWYRQLQADLRRELACDQLDAVILSGDITNRAASDEFDAASQFLRDLKEDFKLAPHQFILVPGNHDLSWSVARQAYRVMRRADYAGTLTPGKYIDMGDYIEVPMEAELRGRFQPFADFYYSVRNEAYPLDYEYQATIHHFPEKKLLILGLNSAWWLDHAFTTRADIHGVALGRALRCIQQEPGYVETVKLAVFHHPVDGPDADRLRDTGFVERLAQAGFRLALHGHIHSLQTGLFRYDMAAGGRQLDFLSAGTFGAPTREWVPGFPLQYQLLDFNGNTLRVHTRRREALNGAWKPDARWSQGPGKNPLPYYDVEL